MIEPVDRRSESPFGRERSDVELEKGRLLPRPADPIPRPPGELPVIDHLARAGNILGLKMRGRVRHLELAIDAELVERAGARARNRELVPAARLRRHHVRPLEHQLDPMRRRRPQPERDAIRIQPGSEARVGRHCDPENASTERAGACDFEPDACS